MALLFATGGARCQAGLRSQTRGAGILRLEILRGGVTTRARRRRPEIGSASTKSRPFRALRMNTLRGTRRAPWPRKEEELDASLQSAREHGTLRWAAEDGAQAIRAFRAQDFDIVLTDLAMPGYSGLQVAEACRRQRPSVKVVMFTAWDLLLDDDQCIDQGVDRVIPTQLRMRAVIDALDEAGSQTRFQRTPRTPV